MQNGSVLYFLLFTNGLSAKTSDSKKVKHMELLVFRISLPKGARFYNVRICNWDVPGHFHMSEKHNLDLQVAWTTAYEIETIFEAHSHALV